MKVIHNSKIVLHFRVPADILVNFLAALALVLYHIYQDYYDLAENLMDSILVRTLAKKMF